MVLTFGGFASAAGRSAVLWFEPSLVAAPPSTTTYANWRVPLEGRSPWLLTNTLVGWSQWTTPNLIARSQFDLGPLEGSQDGYHY